MADQQMMANLRPRRRRELPDAILRRIVPVEEQNEVPFHVLFSGPPRGAMSHMLGYMSRFLWRERGIVIMCIPLFIPRAKQAIWLNIDLIRLLATYIL